MDELLAKDLIQPLTEEGFSTVQGTDEEVTIFGDDEESIRTVVEAHDPALITVEEPPNNELADVYDAIANLFEEIERLKGGNA